LLALYEIGIALVSTGPGAVRITSDILVKQFLRTIGLGSTSAFAVAVLLLGAAVLWYERRKGLSIKPVYLGLMYLEGGLMALILGTGVGVAVGSMFGYVAPSMQAGSAGSQSLIANFFLSLGAGLYEEFLFRLLLVSVLYGLLYLLFRGFRTDVSSLVRYSIAAVIGALIFSAVHYTGALGDDFTVASFTFRFAMGLGLNALMLLRGFGVTAIAHALYDVYVTVLM
jgi:hypothetical protein